MKRPDIRWLAGDPKSQRELERGLGGGLDSLTRLHESSHRSVYGIRPEISQASTNRAISLVLKVHHRGRGLRAVRETLKGWIGQSPARREWRAWVALFEKGVPVPKPRAWGLMANGDEIVACDFLEGEPLAARLHGSRPEDLERLVKLMARTLREFHASGYRHGDLHLGNLWLSSDARGDIVYLLDLESARPARRRSECLVDLAHLEFSLARAGLDSTLRASLRRQLEWDAPLGTIMRTFLRDHVRGRTRRVLRIGRNWAAAEVGGRTGLRETSLDGGTLRKLIEASEGNPEAQTRRDQRVRITEEETGERRFLIKRVTAGHFRRAIGDLLRGSSAARAFRAGQRLALLQDCAAHPLAYLEERRLGFPIQSWLVIEKVGEEDLDQLDPCDPTLETRVSTALGAWLANVHAWGLSHRDFKGGNIRVSLDSTTIRFWMVDLEDLQGPIELSDERRLRALSQLNASLSDEAFSLEARRAGLEIYLARMPIADMDSQATTTEIVRRSLVRRHRWRGRGCKLAESRVSPSQS